MLKLSPMTIYDLRSWRLELICLSSVSLLRLRSGVAGRLRIITFTCSSIWSRFCLEFRRFSLEAAVDILNCLRASSSWDMGLVWVVVAELGSLRPTENMLVLLSVTSITRGVLRSSVTWVSLCQKGVARRYYLTLLALSSCRWRRQHYSCDS